MLKFNSVSIRPALPEQNFEFREGILCLVTDREKTEEAFFSLISGETLPDCGNIENDFRSVSLCTEGLPPEIKVKDYLKFIRKCKKADSVSEKSEELVQDIFDRYIGSLNEFKRVKVSAAAALIGEPDLILLRSPAKKAEPRDIGKLGELIDSLSEFASIIYSCTVPSLFGEHSNKLLVISESKNIAYGNTQEIFALSRKEGGLLARVKGDIDAAMGFLDNDVYEFEHSEKAGVFFIRCADSEQNRKQISAVVRKLGMAVLSLKADNDVLKDMFSSLISSEETAKETLSEEDYDKEELTETDIFEEDESDTEPQKEDEDNSESSESEKSAEVRHKPKITVSFAHSDEEDDE